MSAILSASNAMRAVHSTACEARDRSAVTVWMPADRSMSGERKRTTRASMAACSAPAGGSCGLHTGHTDSGKPYSSQKSPAARNPATSDGLHLVHFDSGSACSTHQSAADALVPPGGDCGLHNGHTDSGNP